MAKARITEKRISCIKTEQPHDHIVEVGIGGDAEAWFEKMTVDEVHDAMTAGVRFVTADLSTERSAIVRRAICGTEYCHFVTVESVPGTPPDLDVALLPVCR